MPSPLAPYLPQIEANPWFAALPPALRADLLAPFGEPVPFPCGRCDRCVGDLA